jgi:hypothetical protein
MRTNENPNFPVPFLIRFSINTKFQFESNSIKYNTEHFGNVRFNINILKVTEIMSMEESNRRIQSDRNPDSIASPAQLTDLTFFTRMSFKASLWTK